MLEHEDIQSIAKNQANIKVLTEKLKCHKVMSNLGCSEMWPVESSQSIRGRAEDRYTPYDSTLVLNQEDIHTIFTYVSMSFKHSLPCGVKYSYQTT